jgi:[Skp1-protein]-hydroxyproline N-acetylglucosaminyltransferase
MLPQHLQLKVLSLLDDGAFNKVVEGGAAGAGAPPVASGRPPDKTFLQPVSTTFDAHRAVFDIKARGLAVFDNFLGVEAAATTRAAADDIAGRGLMRKARMGKDGTQWADSRARGDDMIWLNDLLAMVEAHPAASAGDDGGQGSESGAAEGGVRTCAAAAGSIEEVARTVAKLKDVGTEISSTIGRQFECSRMTFQLARYSDGARYVRHSDVSARTPDRRLTCIYYMNPDWKKADGGELRLYLPGGSPRAGDTPAYYTAYDVAPLMDRLILFRSEVVRNVVCEQVF